MSRLVRIALIALLAAATVAPPSYAVDGPQTDIYYYPEDCGDEVGHKWKECGNSGWQMTGTTGPWMLVVTFNCETSDYQRRYYYGCLTGSCEISEAAWIARWESCA